MEYRLLLFIANTNNFTLLYTQVKRDGKSFIFAVCRLPFAVNVMLKLSTGSAIKMYSVTLMKAGILRSEPYHL